MKSKRQSCFLDASPSCNLSNNAQKDVASLAAASCALSFTTVQEHAHHQPKDFKCRQFPPILSSQNGPNKDHTSTHETFILPHTLKNSNALLHEQKAFSIPNNTNHRNKALQNYEHASKDVNPTKFSNDIPICCSNFNVKSLEPNELNSSVFTSLTTTNTSETNEKKNTSEVMIIDTLYETQLMTIELCNLGVSLFPEEQKGKTSSFFRKILKKTCNIDNNSCDRPESLRTNIFSKCLLKSKFLLEKTSFLGLSQPKNCLSQTLLKNIQGTFLPGRLVAILGPSGSGKSTLLNILAGRLPQTEGQLKINGQIMSSRDLKKISAFIQQVDLFLPNITVEEHLCFQVKLRLDKSISAAKRTILVQEVMTKFGLFKIRDNLIGSSNLSYGISTGERKRLSVATATITNPLILLADEPTTGLDSVMAKSVINSLRYIAATGRTVIASLHQPNTQTFAMFDEVILLAGGRIIYFGDRLGSVEWMKRLGLFCSNHANPSDFLIKCVSLPENPEKQLQKQQQLQRWAQIWEKEGNNFLRQWTEGGRLAFFLSSCSLAKESIELGIPSMASHMSRPFSNDSSKWSINDEILTHKDVLETWSHPYLQNIDVQNPNTNDSTSNPSKIPEIAHNLHVSDIFRPSHLAKQNDFLEVPSLIKRDASDIYGIKNHSKVYFEEPVVDVLCSNPNVKKESQKLAASTLTTGSRPTPFFQSFYSAPAVTSLKYFFSGKSYFEGFTRQKIALRSTKELLKAFRYSGPRPWGHRNDSGVDCFKEYLHPFTMCRPNTASVDRSHLYIMGKPLTVQTIKNLECCTMGVPKEHLRLSQAVNTKNTCQSPYQSLSAHQSITSLKPYAESSFFACTQSTSSKKSSLNMKLQHPNVMTESGDTIIDTNAIIFYKKNSNDKNVNAAHVGAAIETKKGHRFWYQLRILTSRSLASNRRDPILLYARALQTIVIAFMYGSMFFGLQDSLEDARTKVSALFFVLTNQGLVGAAGVCSTFPEEKVVISREREGGYLDTKAYILGKMIADTPIQCVFPILFNVITMLMMNLSSGWNKMLLSCIVALAVCNSAITVGYLGSAAAATSDVALVIAQVWVLPALLFSGFIVIFDDIPKFMRWLQYLSYFRYGFIAYTQLVFVINAIVFFLSLITLVFLMCYVDEARIIHTTPFGEQIIIGNTFIKSYLGITIGGSDRFWTQVACLMIMTIVLRIFIVILLVPLAKNWKEKPS